MCFLVNVTEVIRLFKMTSAIGKMCINGQERYHYGGMCLFA